MLFLLDLSGVERSTASSRTHRPQHPLGDAQGRHIPCTALQPCGEVQ